MAPRPTVYTTVTYMQRVSVSPMQAWEREIREFFLDFLACIIEEWQEKGKEPFSLLLCLLKVQSAVLCGSESSSPVLMYAGVQGDRGQGRQKEVMGAEVQALTLNVALRNGSCEKSEG